MPIVLTSPPFLCLSSACRVNCLAIGPRCPARRMLCAWRSASCSPRTTTSSVRACGGCSRRGPRSRSSRRATASSRSSPRSQSTRPTSSSRTSGCLRRGSTRASRRRGSLRASAPGLGVVVLSQYTDPGYALALLEDGSEGRAYLLKERIEDVDELVAAISAVADGGSVIDPKVVETLVATRAHAEESSLHELTPRELDVLREMAEGKNNAAIARDALPQHAVGREGDPLDLPQARASPGRSPRTSA